VLQLKNLIFSEYFASLFDDVFSSSFSRTSREIPVFSACFSKALTVVKTCSFWQRFPLFLHELYSARFSSVFHCDFKL
jgi:hypothetical protein